MAARTHIPFWVLPMNLVLSAAVAFLGAWVWILSSHGLPREQLEALQLVHQQIGREHVDPPASDELMWSAIEGMVKRCDQHSAFIRPSRRAAFELDTTGAYEGIGIVMAAIADPVVVKFPIPGSPSERAGVAVGDRILAVDQQPLTGPTAAALHEKARKLLLGPEGTEVKLTIQRGGQPPFDCAVERGRVRTPSVQWARLLDADKRIGYVYLKAFQSESADELFAALEALDLVAGGPLRGLVLDLRFNRGGLLDAAIPVANHFLASGTIVTLERRGSQVVETHTAVPEKCTRPNLPLVLLVNGGSASASEVVAGALQDHGRAVLVGERTWGKGVVQSIYTWSDLDFRLKLTTAYYYTPNGRSIEGHNRRATDGSAPGGIAPDRVVSLDQPDAKQLEGVLHETNEPPARYREQVRDLCRQLGIELEEPPGPDRDAQLAAALDEARRLADEAHPAK